MHRRRGRFGKVRPKWQRCTHLQSGSWSREHHQSERRQHHFWREKNYQSHSVQMQHHSSNENSMAKPTTVVVCSEGWGVVFVPGVVVVVLFGGRGAGVTWVTILVLSKNVFINIKIGQIFAPGQNIWIDFMNSTWNDQKLNIKINIKIIININIKINTNQNHQHQHQ